MKNQLLNNMQSVLRVIPRRFFPRTFLMKHNMSQFEKSQGYNFDIEQPRSFNEKLQWYKFNYSNERMTECVDKLAFKSYVQKCLGKDLSPKTLGIWTDIDALETDWDSLPNQFCLKSNCMEMNSGVMIITDKTNKCFDEIKSQVRKWLKKGYTSVNSLYKVYRNVKPVIFAEEYIGRDNSMIDYKFYCFDGKPYCSNATTRVFREREGILDEGIAFYDNEWNVLDGNVAGRTRKIVEKPTCLEEMIEIAAKLSEGFPFMRVDLYCINQRVYTGEIEFYPGAGFGKYEPYEFDLKLGNQFVLPR